MHRADGFAPSFFVIGPPRTGTTWLHEILSNHTVLPTPTKETRFFDIHFHRGFEWYQSHFPKVSTGRPAGEIAPTYFASNEACMRITRTLPQARVVCIFRNPVERVISLYRVKRAYGMVPWEFEDALLYDPELVDTSNYVSKLKFWRNALGADQVLATLYDDLRDSPQSYVDNLVDFISIPRFQLTALQHRAMHGSEKLTTPWSYFCTHHATRIADRFKAHRLNKLLALVRDSAHLKTLFLSSGPPFKPIAEKLKRGLYERFRPEVEELEVVLNRDLSAWKLASVGRCESAA
jgi:hypothetical protein